MQIRERIDQGKANAAIQLGPAGEFSGDVVADHKAVPALLDDEDGADDALVLAQQQAAWGERIAPMQPREDAMLAAHVVRARCYRPQWRPTQHEFALAKAQQISEVCLAAAELPHRERSLGPRQICTQIGFEPGRVEPLVRPLVDQLGRLQGAHYFLSSILATARLCTSSGPSTMRMTRARAQA